MTLYFYNPSEIDIRGATIAGLNAKENTDTAIGFFGTGLKYSIACVLRWGGSITIYSGQTRYTFAAEDMNFRGKDFQRICMNGEPLGFTTEYGKKWEAWQVFRELLANARDEGGNVTETYVVPSEGHTIVAVSCPILEAEYQHRDRIILPSHLPWDYESAAGKVRVAPAQSVYYRGVRVYDRETSLTYNISRDVELTEDRTIKSIYSLKCAMSLILGECTDRKALLTALSQDDGLEFDLEFPTWNRYSEEFLDVAVELYRQSPRKHKRFAEVLKERRATSIEEQEVTLRPIQQLALARAVKLVDKMGMPASTTTIKIVELGNDTLGEYRATTGFVYLDPKVFEQGTKQVVSTLYEELLHKITGLEDCCYEMQTHLFNLIVSLHEEHVFRGPC